MLSKSKYSGLPCRQRNAKRGRSVRRRDESSTKHVAETYVAESEARFAEKATDDVVKDGAVAHPNDAARPHVV